MGTTEKTDTPSLEQDEAVPAQTGQDAVEGAEPVKPVPNGGLQAWLSVLAGFCVFVNSWGLLASYGAFQEYYQTVLLTSQSPSSISWVGSVQATLIVMVGVVTGPLVDSGYLRVLITVGMTLVVIGIMMTSLATQYYQIIMAQGFCVGIGGGIAYIPAMVVISSNFTTKRPIAIGCAAIGSSVGSVVFPIMFRQLQPRIGFPWTVRSIGFINLFLAIITCLILCRKPGRKTRARSMIEWRAFADLPFMLFSTSLTCVMLAYYIPLFYVPSYARTQLHTTRSLSFYMVAIINGASAFGRVVPYLLSAYIPPIAILLLGVAGSALAMFTWIAATNLPGFIVWACYWGFLSGVLVTAPTAIIGHPALCPDPNYLGTRMGMMWGISRVVNLDDLHYTTAQHNSTTAHQHTSTPQRHSAYNYEMAILLRRDCDASNPNSSACEKPVSDFLKTGVPGIIVGILVLIAICVCCYLLYRNKKQDAREAEDARRWNLDK
ncbi:putative MFS monocarboxylate transporter [Aspergillus thermomutatus]|uniref:Major facilitator superfamily (MFS) profile domain-containing protein n=1 Tax=Aspergillus thermomutatus TaxID=41047 RepID=A0A397HX12_ASPTH|nr:uncharacterized protein CDV56_108287 [Aspergillus thermomutatus]RHZ67337.1 hypothetical protein CDV56_108287 [Aspergillus thermomutatus]